MDQHSHHHLGHSLLTIGAFLLLFTMTLLQPANILIAQAISATEIIEQSNEARNRLEGDELGINQKLMSGAQAKAEYMVEKQFFAHFGPDGESPWQFMKEAGYSYEVAGENLAITNEDETKVIEGWLNSPTHRENLLNSDYTDMGIGIAYYGDYDNHKNTTVIVAFYGKPKPVAAVTGTEPTNPAGTVASLQNDLLGDQDIRLLVAASFALIVSGIFLELRHIRHKHHHHVPSGT